MTKENILTIASQEFSSYGYDKVSMNNLATKLNINKATIYYHFKDKKSLYQEIVRNIIKSDKEQIEDIINSDYPPKDKFRLFIKKNIEKVKKNTQIIPLSLREMANLGTNVENAIEENIEEEIELLVALLQELDLKDRYKDLDPYMLKSMIIGTINTYYSMQISNLKFTKMKNLDKNCDQVLDYVGDFISDILLDGLCRVDSPTTNKL